MELRTPRLFMREFTLADFDLIMALHSDPEVMWFITKGEPATAEQVRQFLDRAIETYPHNPGYGLWPAFRRDDGSFVGWFALSPTHGLPADQPELGYRLARSAWGSGFATEGSGELIARAFTASDATRIWAETMAVNVRSRSVLAKLGMRHVDTWYGEWDDPIPGSEQGEVIYEITRAEWLDRARRASGPGRGQA